MGYPMSWPRVIARNGARGNYTHSADPDYPAHENNALAGDLRRLEADQRDLLHLAGYARLAGITPEQAKAVLDAFFAGTAASGLSYEEYNHLYLKMYPDARFRPGGG